MKLLLGLCFIGLVAGIAAALYTVNQGLIVTDMDQQVPWGLDVAAYIFCTGLSAGSFVISSLGLFGLKQFKPISRVAIMQATILLLIAPIFLLVAMGHPERFYYIYLSPNPSSVISWGAYLLAFYPVVCIFYGYYLMKRDMVSTPLPQAVIEKHDRLARFWGLLGVPTAILVHGYTGVLLGFIKGRPLWNTPMMPVLFLTSAILSGIALIIIILHILNAISRHKTDTGIIHTLANMMFFILIIDVFFLGCEVLTGMYGRGGEHFEHWAQLVSGKYALPFMGGEIFLGVVIPILIMLLYKNNIKATVVASVLIIFGVFVMRCNIILGGQIIQTYGGPDGDYFPSTDEWLVMVGLFSLGIILLAAGSKYLPLTFKTPAAASVEDA